MVATNKNLLKTLIKELLRRERYLLMQKLKIKRILTKEKNEKNRQKFLDELKIIDGKKQENCLISLRVLELINKNKRKKFCNINKFYYLWL